MLLFVSSRRRHTISLCDWSSDVCSSDLLGIGTVRALQCRGDVGVDETGQVTSMWGTVQDITERKHAEKEREVISEVIQSVNLTSNLDELLKQVHQSLKKVLYADNCYVALLDKQTGLF